MPAKKSSRRPSSQNDRPQSGGKRSGTGRAESKPRSNPTAGTRPAGTRAPGTRTSSEETNHRVRLQRALAAAGFGSRRQCEELILEGRVEVDGSIVDKLGTTIAPSTSKVFVDGTALKSRRLVYYIVNKPTGVVTTNADPEGRPRVIDLVPPDERVFPVGRLDRSSEGLILLTNDGELAQKLAHPKFEVQKVYRVTVAGNVQAETVRQMHQGIYIAEGLVKVEGARVLKARPRATEMEITLKEGKNREIRRILARLGHKVQTLKRIAIGPLRLGEMPTGAYRRLSTEEVRKLQLSTESTGTDSETPSLRKPVRAAGKSKPALGRRNTSDASDRGETVTRSKTATRSETAPRSKTATRSETAPRGKTATRSETVTRGKVAARSETVPRGKAAARSETVPRGKAAPVDEISPHGESSPRPMTKRPPRPAKPEDATPDETPDKRGKRERRSDRYEDLSEPLIRLSGLPRQRSGIVIGAESVPVPVQPTSSLPIELESELPLQSRRGRAGRPGRQTADSEPLEAESGDDRRTTKSPGKSSGKSRGKRVSKTIASRKPAGGIKASRGTRSARGAKETRGGKNERGHKPSGDARSARPPGPAKRRPGGRPGKGD